MRLSYLFSGIAASCVVLSAAPAWAASDYFLKLDGVKGEAVAGPAGTIEVLSWSWGASNPTSVGSSGLSAGKVSVQDLSVTKREASSGMATGKRVATGDVSGDGRPDVVAAAPAVGSVSTITVRLRESPTLPSKGGTARACATGQHIDSAVLSSATGRVELKDAVVTSCTVQGAERVVELKGHVTLIK